MKKIALLIAQLLLLVSCGNTTQKELVHPARKVFEEAYKAQMDFPESYEFLKMETLDSVTYAELYDKRYKEMKQMSRHYSEKDFTALNKVKECLADSASNVAAYKYKFIVKGNYPYIGEATPVVYVLMTSHYEIIESSIFEEDLKLYQYWLLPKYTEYVLNRKK